MESPDSKATGLYETTCLLGYGMLPLLLHALLCLLAPRRAPLGLLRLASTRSQLNPELHSWTQTLHVGPDAMHAGMHLQRCAR